MLRWLLLFSFVLTVTLEPVLKNQGNQVENRISTKEEEWFQDEDWEEEEEKDHEEGDERIDESFMEDISARNIKERKCGKFPWFIRTVVFLPIVRSGLFNLFKDLAKPSSYGIQNGKNIRIPTTNGSLGAWFLWPVGSSMTDISDLGPQDTLIIYMHGNSATRGFGHRLELYRFLTNLGFYVLSFDYRGFGDSTNVELSETTVVTDGLNVLTWAASFFKDSSSQMKGGPLLIVWGHSLGTSIATITTNQWQGLDKYPISGLVLESSFTTMEDMVQHFKLGRAMVSWLNLNVSAELKCADAEFRSSNYLLNITVPTLALHSEDDRIVPARLGEQLVKSAIDGGKTNISFLHLYRNHEMENNKFQDLLNMTRSIISNIVGYTQHPTWTRIFRISLVSLEVVRELTNVQV
ncbi:monoacylglycerol lipase ABHD12 isoform X2 [Eurytemora carolleeae]|uniref:monoacylglycerol lipase ABHD12 isoform X2 n=1 Tax=Eurytemora carolleeae TaxID=1294199 RepID=UPI000C78D53D|nr:monoacylglycerol lipase ABHD12 isoform X2 [Eurytemora carolleeae]|eukprot:XP_023342993.1 monoacylglycerol lipase ABHD12-like isoform X2 [Eurytemora affinis]